MFFLGRRNGRQALKIRRALVRTACWTSLLSFLPSFCRKVSQFCSKSEGLCPLGGPGRASQWQRNGRQTALGRSWGGLGRSWGALGAVLGRLGRSWSLLGALFYCVGCVGDRGSRPSEPREARRAKAEALMIMYFHVVNCLWLLGWFGDVLSCLGCMLLCIFVLESFSRCGRPRARFVELIRCSRPWACFGELQAALSVFSCSGFEPCARTMF